MNVVNMTPQGVEIELDLNAYMNITYKVNGKEVQKPDFVAIAQAVQAVGFKSEEDLKRGFRDFYAAPLPKDTDPDGEG